MRNGVLFLLFIILSFTSAAQVSANDPEGIIDNFFKIYENDGIKAAVTNIYSYGDSSMQQSLPYVRDTLAHTANFLGGECLGHELIVKKSASPSLVLYAYLVKYKLAPLRFTFVFYKARDKWEIMNFVFDSNTISELVKSSRTDFKN